MEQNQIFVRMALNAWRTQVASTDKFLNSLTADQLDKEIAPGKNRISYLVGHLVAVNDTMISLFGLGERQYAHWDEAFVKTADKSGHSFPSSSELLEAWKKSNALLAAHFDRLSPHEWFSKHTAMSDEDFAREPWRNKLSVLINRTNHLAYHLGQLILAREK